MMVEQEKHPGGRPRLEFDLRQVEELGKIQTTLPELAAVLGCSLSTVKDRVASDFEFSAAYKRGLEAGKSSLRRLQWKSALSGNVVMQIWLGKQYLGQRDQQAVEVSRPRDDEWQARLARTHEGREVLSESAVWLARAMRELARQEAEWAGADKEDAIDVEARDLPAGGAEDPPAGREEELPALPQPPAEEPR
jgi:hypothetical protein